MKKRHYCTKCGSKQNETSMYRIYYHLLNKHAWHCGGCIKSCLHNFPLLLNVNRFPTTGRYNNNGIRFPVLEQKKESAELDLIENDNQLKIE